MKKSTNTKTCLGEHCRHGQRLIADGGAIGLMLAHGGTFTAASSGAGSP